MNKHKIGSLLEKIAITIFLLSPVVMWLEKDNGFHIVGFLFAGTCYFVGISLKSKEAPPQKLKETKSEMPKWKKHVIFILITLLSPFIIFAIMVFNSIGIDDVEYLKKQIIIGKVTYALVIISTIWFIYIKPRLDKKKAQQ